MREAMPVGGALTPGHCSLISRAIGTALPAIRPKPRRVKPDGGAPREPGASKLASVRRRSGMNTATEMLADGAFVAFHPAFEAGAISLAALR